jgi:2,5-diamino-6-(ribosylamino)-4(3H)-pyrimidinone 5'-phosphate reductase
LASSFIGEKYLFPKVIIHNSTSLDGSLTNFEPNMQLHYQLAGSYRPNAHLIGSNTIKVGVELYEKGVPPEEEKDFEKPERNKSLPYWVIPDTSAKLKGLLHTCRRFELCRDIILLLSETTPREYIEHLRERNYNYHIVGKRPVDLEKSLRLLSSEYDVKRVLADTGRILGNLLIEQGLASKLSLLIHPVVVGKEAYNMFGNIVEKTTLKLSKMESFRGGYLWLVYNIKTQQVDMS